MKNLFFIIYTCCSIANAFGQRNDTIELFSPGIGDYLNRSEMFMPINGLDSVLLKEANLEVRCAQCCFWISEPNLTLCCNGVVYIYKQIVNSEKTTYCLSCTKDGRVSHIGACISLREE